MTPALPWIQCETDLFGRWQKSLDLEVPCILPHNQSLPHFCHVFLSLSFMYVGHMTEIEGGAVLNSILRPHLSLDPDGAARMQGVAVQPLRVVSLDGKTDHSVPATGDPNSGGTAWSAFIGLPFSASHAESNAGRDLVCSVRMQL